MSFRDEHFHAINSTGVDDQTFRSFEGKSATVHGTAYDLIKINTENINNNNNNYNSTTPSIKMQLQGD